MPQDESAITYNSAIHVIKIPEFPKSRESRSRAEGRTAEMEYSSGLHFRIILSNSLIEKQKVVVGYCRTRCWRTKTKRRLESRRGSHLWIGSEQMNQDNLINYFWKSRGFCRYMRDDDLDERWVIMHVRRVRHRNEIELALHRAGPFQST
jgi:hypothetical protein